MTKEKALKLQAKKHLQGNWPAAVGATVTVILALTIASNLATLLYSLIITFLSVVNFPVANVLGFALGLLLFLNALAIAFTLPLITGLLRFCYLLSKNSFCDYSQVFYYIAKGKYFPTLKACIILIVKNIWQAVLAFLPAVLFYLKALSNSIVKDNLAFGDFLWYYISYALLFFGIVFFYALTKHNFLAVYFYIENDCLNAAEVCALSQKATLRFYESIIKLILSLLPMMLLCILIIPCLFVIPYVLVTQATSAKWMIALSYKDEI